MAAPTATAAGEIPFINLAAATANWRELCDKVREACETHGCFCLKTDEIPGELRDRMVAALSQLFDLPEDTKKRHVHPKPYRSYLGKNDVVPYLMKLEPSLISCGPMATLLSGKHFFFEIDR
ncbi:Probable inactive 2-oxoglutarate-dependent dioxygenase AOP2 [Linum perenne]